MQATNAAGAALLKLKQPTYTPAELAWRIEFHRYTTVAFFTLLFYDFSVLFGEEYKLVYRSRWTSIKVAYLCCRYVPLIAWSIITYSFVLDHKLETCPGLVIFQHIAYIPLHFCPHLVLMVRAWAFSGRKKKVFVLLFSCLAAYLGIELWVYCADMRVNRLVFTIFEETGCFRRYDFSKRRFGYVTTSSIALDVIAGCVVCWYWWRNGSSPKLGNVHRLFILQGILFFGFMLLSNISSTLLLMNSFKGFDGLPFTTTLLVPNMLACRFILQLRRTASPTRDEQRHNISKQVGRAFPEAGPTEREGGIDVEGQRQSVNVAHPVDTVDIIDMGIQLDDDGDEET